MIDLCVNQLLFYIVNSFFEFCLFKLIRIYNPTLKKNWLDKKNPTLKKL